MRTLCVYCGSNAGNDPRYAAAAVTLGKRIAAEGMGLVYGGGNVGLMGIVADAVLDAGGEVTGV
ncbi:MAG: LOG family protein, partial [Lysobacterales bacterium]